MQVPDLNQIRTFVVLYETRSATIAADELQVTQPTVSYSLRLLRKQFNDELFVRSKNTFVPTAEATRLYGNLRAAMAQIDDVVRGNPGFDPATSTEVMTVALSSMGIQTFLPQIVAALRQASKTMGLRVVPLVATEAEDAVARGFVDLAMSARFIRSERLWRTSFVPVEYVAVTSARHPLPKTGSSMFDERSFVRIGASGGHVYPNDSLEEHGLSSQIVLEMEGYSALPGVLESSDLVALLPRRVAEIFAERHSLETRDLPWKVHSPPVSVYTRLEKALSPRQQWFRDLTLNSAMTV